MPFSLVRLLRSPPVLKLLLAVLAVDAAVVGASYWSERKSLEDQEPLTYRDTPAPEHTWSYNESDGFARPRVRPAGAAKLRDDEPVVGVVVGGKARAYRLRGMLNPGRHILNDVVGDAPVTVTFCDMSDCTRAFTGRRGTGPLDIGLVGVRDGEMVMKSAGTRYFQRSGESIDRGPGPATIPYPTLPLTRTTWGEWRRRHPETDVYIGDE